MLKFLILCLLFFLVSCKETSQPAVKENEVAETLPPDSIFVVGYGPMAHIYPPKNRELGCIRSNDRRGVCCKWSFAWKYNERAWEGEDYDGIVLGSGSALSKEEFMKGLAYMAYPLTAKYDEYLDSNPKQKSRISKIILKFTIETDGSIVNDTILSSTTGNKKFDKEIKNVLHIPWTEKWEKNSNGSTTAIVPITFWSAEVWEK